MRSNIVFTLTGTDRIGIVETVTKLLLSLGGNVETSRMARLGGEFAMLMLVAIESEQLASLEQGVAQLTAEGFKVTVTETGKAQAEPHTGWSPFRIEVVGADHEGIIHQVALYLSQRGITIESMETETAPAPLSGSPLFTMTAFVLVPPSLVGQGWEAALAEAGDRENVDITVAAVTA